MGDKPVIPPYELDVLLCELSTRRSDGSGSAGAYGETPPALDERGAGGAASGRPSVAARSGRFSRILLRNSPTKRVSPCRKDVTRVRKCERWSRGLTANVLGSGGMSAMTSTRT